jgi:bacterioferritin-associated ferredoxin
LRLILKKELRINLNFVIIAHKTKNLLEDSIVIICLCKGVSDRKVREMARNGQTLKQIVESSEASTCCGACAIDLKDLVKQERERPAQPSQRINPCS